MNHRVTDRGFKWMDPILDRDGGQAQLLESSLATEPAIRLTVHTAPGIDTEPSEGALHLTLGQAAALRDQLEWLIGNHYQTEDGQRLDLCSPAARELAVALYLIGDEKAFADPEWEDMVGDWLDRTAELITIVDDQEASD